MSANKQTKITMLVEAGQAKAAYAEMSASSEGFSKAAASSGVAAQASLTQIEAAQRRVASSSQVESAGLRQVAAAEFAMAAGAVEATATTESLAVSQNEVAAATRGAGAAQIQGAAANQVGAAAAAENAAAQAALGAESEISAARMIKVGVAIDKLTGVAIPGGKALGSLAGAFSTMSLASLAAIAGVALLVGWMIHLFKEKEDQIKIDQEQISLDVKRHEMLATGTLFTREYANVLHDLNASSVTMTNASRALALAQANENDAIRGSTTLYKDAAANTTDLAQKVAIYAAGLFASVEGEQEAISKRLEATKTMRDEIAARIRLAAEMGLTAAALIAERRAAGDTQAAIDLLTGALNLGALAQARYRAGQGVIGEVRTQVAQEAAAAGVTLTHAEAIKRFNAELARRGDATVKLNVETVLAEKNLKSFNEEHLRGAGAARAHAGAERAMANELINLTKRAAEADAALRGDSFGRREETIRLQIQAEKDHLEINKRDRVAALAALAAIERAQLEKVSQDRVEAEQRVMVEIARVHIALIRDDTERKRAEMALDIAMRSQAIAKEFGDTVQAADLIAAYRRAKLAEFNQWEKDANAKHWLDQRRAREDEERQLYDKLRQERQKFLVEQRQQRQEMERRHFESFGGQFSDRKAGVGQGIDINRVKALEEATRRLGLSQVQFDHALQATNRDLASFERLMNRTQQFTRGNWFAGLIGSIRDVGKAFVEGGLLGQAWSDAIVGAIEITLQSGGNFAATFGKLLLGSILSAFGQMAIAQGTFHILSGIALMANPWTFAQGARELAGGTALVAFGALLGAAGSMLQSSARGSGAGAGSASQSSAAGAPTTSPPSSSGRASGPVLINVPTSAPRQVDRVLDTLAESRRDLAEQRANREAISQRNAMQMESGPITIAVTLGTEAGEKFLSGILDGRGVLTINNALGQHRKRLINGLKK